MKKFLFLFLALFAMTFFAKAQTSIFSEDFENGMPAGWTQIDANNDNYGWEHSSNPVSYHTSGVDLSGTGHNGSDGYVFSGSYSNVTSSAITPDNWLITPAITLNGAATLSFWICSQDVNYSAEHYGVYISTTDSANTSSFTLLQEWTIGQNREQTAWENHTVNLSAYNGQTVYIAFRHFNCNDQFILNLDDVTITVLTSDPLIVANPTSLTMSALLGLTASTTAQVDGYNLTSTITATTAAPFEVSADGITYATTASLAQAGGPLYVRYTPTAAGTDNETITLTSGTATASITLTGTAVDCNVSLPFTETFNATSASRDCWTLVSNNTANVGGTYGMGFVTVDNSEVLRFSSYTSATDYNQYAFSPMLNVSSSATNLSVNVTYATYNTGDYLYFGYITPTDTIWDPTSYQSSGFETLNFVIPATATQLAIHYYGNYAWYAWVDEVAITEMTGDYCYPVTNLTANGVTAHEATLTWSGDANDYTIYDLSDTSFVATVSDTTYTLTSLTSDTQHNFGVVANCTSSSSNMVAVSFHTLISCPVPTDLAVVLTPGDGTVATLNWHENGTATAWQICFDGDETNLIDVTDTSHNFTGLTAEQIYTAKVRAICDANDHSAWSSTISFQPTTKTVIGSGNTTSSYLPTNCYYRYSLTQQIFTVAEVGDAGLIESIDFYNNGSSPVTRDLSLYVVSTTKDTFASTTDWISVTAADLQYSGNVTFAAQAWTTITLDGFVYDGLSNIAIIIDDNTGDYVNSIPFKVFNANKQALRIYSDGTNYEVIAPTYTGSVMTVKNQIRLAKGSLDGCLKPSGVTVNYTGGNEATVTWTSDAATININVNGTVTNNVTSPYTLTGLNLGTTYTVSLQAECSSTSTSDWTNPISFTTDVCMPENQCTISIYAEDSYGDGWSNNTINIIQNGITIASYSMASSTMMQTAYDTLHVNVCSGIPVSFSWVSGGAYSYPDEISFSILDGGGSVVYSISDATNLDGVFFTLNNACPSCLPATALTVDAITENSVTISWTGTAASYDIYNGENFVANVTTNTYTFTGLTTATSYTFGVQAICSADDSASVATVNVTTSCSTVAINLPFSESFNANSGTRDCWTTINSNGDNLGWTTLYSGVDQEMMLSFSYDNNTQTAVIPNNWLISPKLHSNAGSNVTMEWIVGAGDNNYYAEHYGVYVSTTTTDTTAFTLVNEWTLTSSAQSTQVLDLSAYAGQDIYVAFRHFNCNNEFVLIIDDVELYEGAYVPDTLTVTFAVNNAAMGTTNPVPGTYQYIDGETVSFSAVANAGYHFVTWEYTLGSSTEVQTYSSQSAQFNTTSFINYGSINFTAVFEAGNPDSTTITYTVNDPTMGTTTPAPGTYTIYVGNSVEAAATANAGYELTSWILDFTMNGTVYNIDTVNINDPDFANPINFGTLPQNLVDYGATLTVTAVFAPSTPGTESLTFHLSINNPALGSINPNPGTYVVALNDSLVLSATPNAGINFDGWRISVGDQSLGTIPLNPFTIPVTPNNIMLGEMTIVAMFNDGTSGPDSMTVIINTADVTMGTTSPAPGIYNFAVGSESHIAAIPNEGYHNLYWIEYIEVAGMSVSDTLYADTVILTVNPIMAGLVTSLTAYFEADEPGVNYYNVNVSSANLAMGTVSSSTPYTHLAENTVVTVTATPNTGYRFVNWTDGAGNVVNATNPYTFTVTADITLIANFELIDAIEDITLAQSLSLMPNPADNYIELSINSNVEVKEAVVFNAFGQMIQTVQLNNNHARIDLSNVASGMYFVRVNSKGVSATKKFIRK